MSAASITDRTLLARLWAADALLTGTGLGLLALAVPFALGIWLDPRVIAGAPAWLKPTKFALSAGLYQLTLAWLFTYLASWRRTRRAVAWVTTIVWAVEIPIIGLQAWRGTTSHFNVSTPLDGALFGAMGLAILVQTLASVAVAVALWRQTFVDRAVGWALRLGLSISILGAVAAGLMLGPTADQRAGAQATGRMTRAGAHTVGGPDGGPGLPVTGWSTAHGDLRVPHFLGLHAVQILPMLTLGLLRKRDEPSRTRLTLIAAAVYTLVFAALLMQALRGVPLVAIG